MQTGNRIRNKAYLDEYADILSKTMYNKLDGQSILYIVKGILISGKPCEDCWGYASLDAYLKQQRRIEKIEYIRQHMDVLNMNLTAMIDGQSILYAIKEILVSNKQLKCCRSYKSLNQYIEKNEESQEQLGELQNPSQELQIRKQRKEEIELLHILSSVVSVVNRSQDMNQVNRITPFYQCVGNSQNDNGYQKQMASIA